MTRPGDQRTPEWYAERRTGYGASDAPILIEGDEAAWRQLHGEKLGLLPPREGNETMQLGIALEDTIARIAAERYGWKLNRVNRIVRHPDLPYVFASLDRRRAGDRIPVEVKKWSHKGDDWGPDGSDVVPPRILYQVQQQAAVTGADAVEVVTLFGGAKLERFTVGRDGTIIDEILALEAAAWQYVARGEMPPWPGQAPQRIVLAHDEVPVDEELAELVAWHERMKVTADDAKRHLDQAKDALRERLADAGGAKGPGISISHRPTEPGHKVAWELVAKAYRSAIEQSRDWVRQGGPVETPIAVMSADLDAIESMFTTTTAPMRPLRVTVKGPKA
jgi:putative phage-type endonuclease